MNRYFPYSTLTRPLSLEIEEQLVDGARPPYDMLAARHSINISGLESSWRRLAFRLRVDLPGLNESPDVSDVRVVLSLNCSATNLRMGVLMKPGVRQGSYTAELEIEAGALAKKATLRAIVSGKVEGVAQRYLGESEVWNVWTSSPEIPLLTGDLQVKWVAFAGETCPATIDPAFRSQPYYIDITQDPPVIYLNESLPDLRRLFDDYPRRNPVERALRDSHFHSIASSGWLAMFNASLGGIEPMDDGHVEWPDIEWQRQVLRTILPKVYPDLSLEDSVQTAYGDASSADGSRLLQSRAMAAICGLLRGSGQLRNSIKALEESL